MKKNRFEKAVAVLCLCLAASASQACAEEAPTFERDVRPIFKAYCFECHGGGETLKGKLDLRLRRFVVKGGKSGPAVVFNQPRNSLLIERLKAGEMPPGEKKLSPDQIAVIARWIATGARALRDEPASLPPGIDITPQERAYWFFQPLGRPTPPKFVAGDRVRTPIDAFVLTRLRDKGLSFNPDADPLTLMRRVSLDLTGLPPTAADIDEVAADKSGNAYERYVDRLLSSPHYGERWARHWLDVAGYADSDGDGTNDTVRPYAWRYRDYVIRALNMDKPLDRFITEQLAGDELVPRPWNNLKPEQIDLLAATGFLRTAPDATTSGGGAAEAQQVVADTLKIVGSTLLGLTVGCAQCHDHRYDPIPQADYFRLRAVFEPAFDPGNWRRAGQRRVSLYTDADRAKAAAIEAEAGKMDAIHNDKQSKYVATAFEKELAKFPMNQRGKLRSAFKTADAKRTAEQKKLVALNPKLNISPGVLYQYNRPAADELKKMREQINAKRAQKPIEEYVDILSEVPGAVPVTRIFYRGDYRQQKAEVYPGDLTIAAPEGKRAEIAPKSGNANSSGRRLAFARHLMTGQHPLVGRVLANRIWLHHFGQGIVDTPGDFGVLGRRPSHPELLDWLADELARGGWSLKHLHKLIVTSTVYRQSSRRNPAQAAVDSSNTLYARYPVHRLDAEVLRDRVLATTGQLDAKLFGPPLPVSEDAVGTPTTPDEKPRRSIYLQVRRTKPVAFLATFDAPAGELNCDRRLSSTTAPQALMLMNSDFVLKQAAHLARRLKNTKLSVPERIAQAWRLAYQRPVSPVEAKAAQAFIERQIPVLRAQLADPELAAWTNLCQQLLSSNEFLYVD